jgi:hypothetical protein
VWLACCLDLPRMLAVCDVLSGCRFGLRVRMRWFGDLICLNLSDLDLDRFDDMGHWSLWGCYACVLIAIAWISFDGSWTLDSVESYFWGLLCGFEIGRLWVKMCETVVQVTDVVVRVPLCDCCVFLKVFFQFRKWEQVKELWWWILQLECLYAFWF